MAQRTGVASAPANLAIEPSVLAKDRYCVGVLVPALANEQNCAVGRTGKVWFGQGSGAVAAPKPAP